MEFLDHRKAKIESYQRLVRRKIPEQHKLTIPDGLFVKCLKCQEVMLHEQLAKNYYVCPKCDYHHKLTAEERIALVCDRKSFVPLFDRLETKNVLDFPDYEKKIEQYRIRSGLNEAFVCGTGAIKGIRIALGILDPHFMMGSMGSVVGEKVTRLIEYSTQKRLPLIIFSASGGARMQEGIYSLMQMAKTAGALYHHDKAGLLYISVLTDPTTGGVAASFSSLGDYVLAERNALIGFAGKRVIEQTINQKLPDGFQTAEFQLKHGFVDRVVERSELRDELYRLLNIHERGERYGERA
ncbi:MAG TPA: acetyl-CoA carboxylase, carboxyltransferase subunit beta [Haloplasmataceae bacterium]